MKTGTRHMKRKAGTVVVSIPMPNALKAQIAEVAERDQRPMAAWIRMQLASTIRRSVAARRAA